MVFTLMLFYSTVLGSQNKLVARKRQRASGMVFTPALTPLLRASSGRDWHGAP
jgi:hypothetical protein